MKVAHLTTVDLSLRYLVFPQMLAVKEAGGDSIGISAPGPWVEELEAAGIRHIPLRSSTRGMNVLADLRAARELWKILRRENLDVLHTHNPKPGLYGRVLGRLAGVPIVVNTVHGLYATPDDSFPKRGLVYALEALAARFSDAELIQNPEDLALLTRWRITPRARTELLGNGVDLDRFRPDKHDRAHRTAVRNEWGVGDDQIVVGIVGRLVAEKGYPELFEAVEQLDERFVLVCIGPHDPDKSDELPRELIEKARANGVRFLGMRTDVDALYPALDLFVLPSHREGFPRAAMEAAASGLPVIATDIRGCRQVVEPGVNGLLIPVKDPAALAAAIRKLGEDAATRAAMGKAGRQRAQGHFDERQVVAKVMAAYREVARRKGLTHLLDTPSAGRTAVTIRRAVPRDAAYLASLHTQAIDTGFLPQLGSRFMARLYRALIAWEPGVVLVADDGEGPVGFVAGVPDTGDFYRHFVARHGIAAALAALPRLGRPSLLRRAWETLRYDGAGSDVRAELLSTAVAADRRGQGLGTRLGATFLDFLDQPQVKVVVGAANPGAIAAYEKLGFIRAGSIEVHAGEPSLELLWSASP